MINRLKGLWQKWSAPTNEGSAQGQGSSDVGRIAALQNAASQRRAEYAALSEQALRSQNPPTPSGAASMLEDAISSGPLMTSRKHMEEADSAHIAALQKWENKQSGQKCY